MKIKETIPKTVVAIYIRVSTQEQASEGYSIGEQNDRLVKYCEAQGWIVYKVYSDPGFSGGSLDRPGLRSLISDVTADKVNKVVVFKLDRLSRSQKDTLYLIEDIFLKNDVDFVSMTENFDTGTPLGRAMIGILSVFAQLEREQIKERMSMGKEGRAKSGLWHGGFKAPIGYRYKDNVLSVDPYEAEYIRRIFREYAAGRTLTSITNDLIREGVRTYYGLFTYNTIRTILDNVVYLGIIKHNDREYPGLHEAIIDRETFDKVQKRLEYQRKTDVSHLHFSQKTSLITGLCYCADCKRKMIITHGWKRKDGTYNRYLTCSKKREVGCKNQNYRVDIIEDYILDQIQKLTLDPKYFESVRSETPETKDLERLEILEDRIKGNENKISRLMDLYAIGGIEISQVKAKVDEISLETETLREEVDRIKKEITGGKSDEEIKDLVYKLDQYIEEADVEKTHAIVASLIRRIECNGKEITIFWSF